MHQKRCLLLSKIPKTLKTLRNAGMLTHAYMSDIIAGRPEKVPAALKRLGIMIKAENFRTLLRLHV